MKRKCLFLLALLFSLSARTEAQLVEPYQMIQALLKEGLLKAEDVPILYHKLSSRQRLTFGGVIPVPDFLRPYAMIDAHLNLPREVEPGQLEAYYSDALAKVEHAGIITAPVKAELKELFVASGRAATGNFIWICVVLQYEEMRHQPQSYSAFLDHLAASEQFDPSEIHALRQKIDQGIVNSSGTLLSQLPGCGIMENLRGLSPENAEKLLRMCLAKSPVPGITAEPVVQNELSGQMAFTLKAGGEVYAASGTSDFSVVKFLDDQREPENHCLSALAEAFNQILCDQQSPWRLHFFAVQWENDSLDPYLFSSVKEPFSIGFAFLKESQTTAFFSYPALLGYFLPAETPSYHGLSSRQKKEYLAEVKAQGLITLTGTQYDSLVQRVVSAPIKHELGILALVPDLLWSRSIVMDGYCENCVDAFDPNPPPPVGSEEDVKQRSFMWESMLHRITIMTRGAFNPQQFYLKVQSEKVDSIFFEVEGKKYENTFNRSSWECQLIFYEWVTTIINTDDQAGYIVTVKLPESENRAILDPRRISYNSSRKLLVYLTLTQEKWLRNRHPELFEN